MKDLEFATWLKDSMILLELVVLEMRNEFLDKDVASNSHVV
jgi:hypothetical protein